VRCQRAIRIAGSVGSGVDAIVALLELGLHDSIAAMRASLAVRGTTVVRSVVALHPKIALFAVIGLRYAVAATRTKGAGGAAMIVGAGILLGAVVTLFTWSDLSVAAASFAFTRGQSEARQRQAERRTNSLPLGLEDANCVDLAILEAKISGRGLADRHVAVHGLVPTAKVDCQLAVDEHPNVVVASKLEFCRDGLVVFEPVLDL